MEKRFDSMTLVALLFILFLGYNVVKDRLRSQSALAAGAAPVEEVTLDGDLSLQAAGGVEQAIHNPTSPFSVQEMEAVAAPYTDYVITQRLHGASYGHAAIDLAAGKGAPVLSPINGFVSDFYVDPYGNPTLIIENDFYRVTMLHGKYSVSIGQLVTLGQQVGKESNKGYTTDMQGRLCTNRNCGYHTHLNIFDKRKGKNVNPLKLIQP